MRAVALALALLAIPSIALAQAECEEGRVRVDERCCWPGQTFSAERLRCEGEPQCPEALALHGEACVGRASLSGPPLPPPPTDAASTEPPPTRAHGVGPDVSIAEAYGVTISTTDWPLHGEEHPWHSARVRGEDEGLITSAFSVFEFGFLLGWLTAGLDEQSHTCFSPSGGGPFGGGASSGCNSWPLAFIPVGGGLASGLASFGTSSFGFRAFGFIFGIPSAILQFAGLIGMIVAFSNSTDEVAFQPIGDPHAVTLSFVPSAPGTDVGGSLNLSF